ncbi:MAG: hypothetical protein VKK04_04960 [Synechococcales bacterium]|nr:hypothetical protein [Synechococcales bacterium]
MFGSDKFWSLATSKCRRSPLSLSDYFAAHHFSTTTFNGTFHSTFLSSPKNLKTRQDAKPVKPTWSLPGR